MYAKHVFICTAIPCEFKAELNGYENTKGFSLHVAPIMIGLIYEHVYYKFYQLLDFKRDALYVLTPSLPLISLPSPRFSVA